MLETYNRSLQATVRQQASVIGELERQLEEMRLYLSREEPNTAAALRRLALAQNAIADYRTAQAKES